MNSTTPAPAHPTTTPRAARIRAFAVRVAAGIAGVLAGCLTGLVALTAASIVTHGDPPTATTWLALAAATAAGACTFCLALRLFTGHWPWARPAPAGPPSPREATAQLLQAVRALITARITTTTDPSPAVILIVDETSDLMAGEDALTHEIRRDLGWAVGLGRAAGVTVTLAGYCPDAVNALRGQG